MFKDHDKGLQFIVMISSSPVSCFIFPEYFINVFMFLLAEKYFMIFPTVIHDRGKVEGIILGSDDRRISIMYYKEVNFSICTLNHHGI